MKKPKEPKAPFRVVKIQKPIIPPDGEWLLYDEHGDVYETISPDKVLSEMMLGRLVRYVLGRRHTDYGWEFKAYKGKPLYW